MLPLLRDIRQSLGDAQGLKLAALPVCYRTNGEYPTMQAFGEMDEKYLTLDCHTCTRGDLFLFAKACVDLGVSYIGTCCGAPHHIRAMAEAVGKKAIASEFSPDLAKHFVFGDKDKNQRLKDDYLVAYQIRREPAASIGQSVYGLSRMTALASSTDRFFLTKRHMDAKGSRLI